MKRTYRIICSLLFIVMLIFSISMLPVSAIDTEAYDVIYTLEADASKVDAGDFVKLSVSITKNSGFKYSKVIIDYSDLPVTFVSDKDFPGYDISNSAFDSKALLIKHNGTDKIVNINTGDGMAAIINPDTAPTYDATGLVAVLFFKVNDDFDGKITFTLEVADMIPKANVSAIGGEVTVSSVCEGAHTHVPVVDEAVAPTCTETGLTEGSHCDICKEVLVPQETVGELHHDYEYHDGKEPTCTEEGYNDYATCSRCDFSNKEVKEKLGHSIQAIAERAPTCTEPGWNAYEYCSRCDYTTYAEIPALEHDLTQHEAKAPDCENIGWDAYEDCSRCDYTTYEEIPALEHKLTQHEAKTPTCTEAGWDAYVTCERC
ncbi:MAG: hypothetical protein J6K33_05120, partial [Alistipes sp.]|nr:hypothetical protein [Alistipes sp.]